MDLLDMYDRASTWTKSKIEGAKHELDTSTPCDEWNVRAIVNHLLHGQQVFQGAARGDKVGPPQGMPPELVGDDPVAQYDEARQATLDAYREPGVLEKAGPTLGIAVVDQLVHGNDLAKATGQDETMPADIAEAAFGMVNGRLTDENRGTAFKPAVSVSDDASAQDKLLAYLGRKP